MTDQKTQVPINLDPSESLSTDTHQNFPRPDFGALTSFSAAFQAGFKSNLTGMAWRSAKYLTTKLATEARYRGEDGEIRELSQKDWVDEKEFKEKFSLGGTLKFDPHFHGRMSRAYAQELYEDQASDIMDQFRGSLSHSPVASLSGGLVGGVADPVGAVTGYFIPTVAIAKFGLGATVASRSGWGGARLATRTMNGAVNGAASNALMLPGIVAVDEYNQTNIARTLQDQAAMVGMGFGLGGLLGGIHGTIKIFNPEFDRTFANYVMFHAASDKDGSMAARFASQSPKFQELLNARRQAREAMEQQAKQGAPGQQPQFMADPASASVPQDLVNFAKELEAWWAKSDAEKREAEMLSFLEKAVQEEADRAVAQEVFRLRNRGMLADAIRAARENRKLERLASDDQPSQAFRDWVLKTEGERIALRESERRATLQKGLPAEPDAPRTPRYPKHDYSTAEGRMRLLDEILSNREDDYVRSPRGEDEAFMAEAWKRLFGVQLKFVDPGLAHAFGFLGYVRSGRPDVAYVAQGLPLNSADVRSMMFVAGHELGHSIRSRDPEVWSFMVDAMMRTASEEGGGEIGRAWSTVVEANRDSGVWRGLPRLEQRMDETFATVLGQAMQNRKFWDILRQDSPRSTGILAGLLKDLRSTLGRLGRPMTPALRSMYDGLSLALNHSGLENATEPVEVNLRSLYLPHRKEFNRVTRMLSEVLTKSGIKVEAEFATFAKDIEDLFPEVGQFEDSSGTPQNPGPYATILTRRRIDSNNPGLYLLLASFKGMYYRELRQFGSPQSKQAKIFAKWKKGGYESEGNQDARGRPDYVPSMLKDLAGLLREGSDETDPIAAFKRNEDGTWDIAVYRNDDYPHWREVFEDLPATEDLVKESYLTDYFHQMEMVFGQWLFLERSEGFITDARMRKAAIAQAKQDESVKPLRGIDSTISYSDFIEMMYAAPLSKDTMVGIIRKLDVFLDFVRAIPRYELVEMIDNDPQLIWQRYREHLEKRLGDHLASEQARTKGWDALGMAEHLNELDTLIGSELPPGSRGLDPEFEAGYRQYLKDLNDQLVSEWKKVTQGLKNVHDEIDARSSVFRNELDTHVLQVMHEFPGLGDNLSTYYVRMLEKTKAEIRNEFLELAETKDVVETLMKAMTSEDQNLAFQFPGKKKNPKETPLVDARRIYARNTDLKEAGLVGFSKVVEEMAHERMRNTIKPNGELAYPHYDQIMSKARKLEDFVDVYRKTETISLYSEDLAGLPSEYADAADRFVTEAERPPEGLSDYDFMAAPAGAQPPVRNLSWDERVRLRAQILEQRADKYRVFLEDPSKAVDPALQIAGVKHWALVDKPVKAGEKPPKPEGDAKLLIELNSTKNKFSAWTNTIGRLARGEFVPEGGFRDAVNAEYQYHLRQHDGNIDAAVAAAIDSKMRETNAELVGKVLDFTTSARWDALAKSDPTLSRVKSRLDGQARKGVVGEGASIAEEMTGRVIDHTNPLYEVLVDTGLLDLFEANDPGILQSIAQEMRGIRTGNEAIARVADTLKKTLDMQGGMLNAHGAHIRPLAGRMFGQVHDAEAILANRTAWIEWVAPRLNAREMKRLLGPNRGNEFDVVLHLNQMLHEMEANRDTGPFDANLEGGNLGNQVSRRRTLIFNGDEGIAYDMEWGSGNTANLIFQQLRKRAEQITVMQHFGPRYLSNWSRFMARVGLEPNPTSDGAVMGVLRKFDNLTHPLHRLNWTFHELVGDLNHPKDVNLARWTQTIKNMVNGVTLWLSGVSSVTDLANSLSLVRFAGYTGKDAHSRLMGGFVQGLKSGDSRARRYLMAQGAAFEAVLGALARSYQEGWLHNAAQKLSDTVFRFSGLDASTRAAQMSVMDLLTQHFGEMARTGETTPEFLTTLSHYGITPEQWHSLSQYAATIEGLDGVRLSADLIPDEVLSGKLRAVLMDMVHQAVLQPNLSDRAMLTMGIKAGTPAGMAIRLATQFKGYPLGVLSRVHARFRYAYGPDGGKSVFGMPINRGMLEYVAWSASIVALASTVLAIKDVLRFREPFNPMDPEQWNKRNLSRLVIQAGFGPVAVIEQFLDPRQLIGPGPGMAAGLIGNMAALNGYGTINSTMGMTPGLSIPPIREATKALLGTFFAESYGVQYQMFLERLESDGQTSLFLDK